MRCPFYLPSCSPSKSLAVGFSSSDFGAQDATDTDREEKQHNFDRVSHQLLNHLLGQPSA